jgi:sugar-specific transcriptional regulator TrmB
MPLVKAINGARKSVEIVIFRLNRSEIEKALAGAVTRGVHVHALIAYTNRGGEQRLRDLEMRLLAAGVTVSRTDDDLVRYHGKLMIVDRKVLFLLAFNFTYLDMERSRTFGIVTTNRKHVEQAARLFDADTQRQPYTAGSPTFIVSPVNARKQLTAFIKAAKKELLIYDPEVSDPDIVRVLEARVRAGVVVRIIGKLKTTSSLLPPARTLSMRLHTRSIWTRGAKSASSSAMPRRLPLSSKHLRKIGKRKVNRRLWRSLPRNRNSGSRLQPPVAKKVAKAVADDMSPVKPVFELTLRELSGAAPNANLNHAEMEATVKQAVHDAVKQVVRDFVEEAAETEGAGTKP